MAYIKCMDLCICEEFYLLACNAVESSESWLSHVVMSQKIELFNTICVRTSDPIIYILQTIWRQHQEGSELHSFLRENVKSHEMNRHSFALRWWSHCHLSSERNADKLNQHNCSIDKLKQRRGCKYLWYYGRLTLLTVSAWATGRYRNERRGPLENGKIVLLLMTWSLEQHLTYWSWVSDRSTYLK